MRWCHCKNTSPTSYVHEFEFKDLLQKQHDVEVKEKELMERERQLQKRLKEVSARTSFMAKKDLIAAKKLKHARKKLTRAINNKENLDKCKKNCGKEKLNKKKRREKSKKKNKKIDGMLHNFFDNYFKMDDKIKKIQKIKVGDFFGSLFTKMLIQTSSHSSRSYGSAGDCYLMSLQKTPQVWIYHRWPHLYPPFLDLRAQYKNCKFFCMFFLGFLFWIPFFIFIEVCKCFLCCCCHDC